MCCHQISLPKAARSKKNQFFSANVHMISHWFSPLHSTLQHYQGFYNFAENCDSVTPFPIAAVEATPP